MAQSVLLGGLLAAGLTGAVGTGTHQFQSRSTRTATPLEVPQTMATYASAFSDLSSVLGPISYTSYSMPPVNTGAAPPQTATSSATALYDQAAYNALWQTVGNVTTPPYTTTVNATPVASSELIYPSLVVADPSPENYTFDPDFYWGVASSGNQYEGAVANEGRSPSVLDALVHNPLAGPTIINADVLGLGYYNYKQDIARMAALGIGHYSFNIPWPRVVPFGTAGSPVNEEALAHYDDVIDTCLEYGIEPHVTLFHWDTPSVIAPELLIFSTLGVLNPGTGRPDFIEDITYFGKIVLARYADRVGRWVTFNEPQVTMNNATGVYNILIAHATFYDFYKNTLNGTGEMTIKQTTLFAVPYNSTDEADIIAAQRSNDMTLGLFSNPIFGGIDIPADARNTTGLNFPTFTEEELRLINGSADTFAIDMYGAALATPPIGGIEACKANASHPDWPTCVVLQTIDESGFATGYSLATPNDVVPVVFSGIPVREWLRYIWEVYSPPSITVTEFGYSDRSKILYANDVSYRTDPLRQATIMSYVDQMLRAQVEDGIKMAGAVVWAMLDMWEFGNADVSLGLQGYDPITFKRFYKQSMFAVVDYFEKHTVPRNSSSTSTSASPSAAPSAMMRKRRSSN